MDDLIVPFGTSHPDSCPECDDVLLLVSGGRFGVYYRCINYPECSGSASAHADGRPMGTAEGTDVKRMRILAHRIFRNMYETGMVHRTSAEEWLVKKIGTSHFAQMNEKQITDAVRELQRFVKV